MAVSTSVTTTPWTVDELRAIYGLRSGSRARERQDQLDRIVVEVLAPHYVARGVRADQAARAIEAFARHLHRLCRADPQGAHRHLSHLMRLAYDRAAEKVLKDAARRLPAQLGKPHRRATAAGAKKVPADERRTA